MDKKIALVTGAARGLGESIARKMHAAGYKVALADIDLEQVSAVAASLDASGATAMPLALDVRRKPDFIAACDAIELRWGGAAVLVNNAGRSRVAALMEITPEEWDEVTAINMKARFLHARCSASASPIAATDASSTSPRWPGRTAAPPPARTMLRPRARC
jgi:3-oxoacyl-[acyl-carrier protein] reductase